MSKRITLFPHFRCLEGFSVNMKEMCFLNFHVKKDFSGNRKNCDRNTEGTTERLSPWYRPHWMFYFWPKNWAEEYITDISVSNVYSLYWSLFKPCFEFFVPNTWLLIKCKNCHWKFLHSWSFVFCEVIVNLHDNGGKHLSEFVTVQTESSECISYCHYINKNDPSCWHWR